MADSSSDPKLYTIPNHRKQSGKSKKGGDRASHQQNKDGEKSQPLDAALKMEKKTAPKIIPLKDCSKSEAYQLLSDRWAQAMHLYNDPTVDLSERPIMYYGGSVWGKLPHQILASASKTLPPPSDYIPEARRRSVLTPRPR